MGRPTPCFLDFNLIIGRAALVLLLRSCTIENTTLKRTHSARAQAEDTYVSRRHSHLSAHAANVWAQMQKHILSLHCGQGADVYWRLKVYCGWLANYYTSWGTQPASFNQHWSDTKTESPLLLACPFYVTNVLTIHTEHWHHPLTIL